MGCVDEHVGKITATLVYIAACSRIGTHMNEMVVLPALGSLYHARRLIDSCQAAATVALLLLNLIVAHGYS